MVQMNPGGTADAIARGMIAQLPDLEAQLKDMNEAIQFSAELGMDVTAQRAAAIGLNSQITKWKATLAAKGYNVG